MMASSSLTHTPDLGGHPPLSSPPGSLGLSLGQTHPGQVAEPQMQGMAQPVGIVSLHDSLETMRGAGGREDVLQCGLCTDLVRAGWLVPLEGEGTVGWGFVPEERVPMASGSQETLTRGGRCQKSHHQSPGQPHSSRLHSEQDFCWETEGDWA